MNVTSRAIPALAFVLLASLVAACGVKESGSDAAATTTTVAATTTTDEPTTTTSEPESTTTTSKAEEPATTTTTKAPSTDPGTPGGDDVGPAFEEAFFQELVDGFIDAGLTKEQAECLANSYGRDLLDGSADMGSVEGLMEYFDACDIPLDAFDG